MPRLTDVDALKEAYCRANECEQNHGKMCFCCLMADVLADAPTIDPESLRPKGEWITMTYWKKRRGHRVQYVVKKCSVCNFRVKARWKNNFCPNCGADMRGEKDERKAD